MSFSSDDDYGGLDGALLATVDLSHYDAEVIPSQRAPPPAVAVKQERIQRPLTQEDEWDMPLVGKDGSYVHHRSPAKQQQPAVQGSTTRQASAAAPLPPPPAPVLAARPPPPRQPVLQHARQPSEPPPASQSGFPSTQGAAARRAAVLAFSAAASSSTTAQGTRGQSMPPSSSARIGGFSQRPMAPPLAPMQRPAGALQNGKMNHFGLPGAGGAAHPSLRAANRASTPGLANARADGAMGGGGAADADAVEQLRLENQRLLQELKAKDDKVFTAAGEASMLRTRMLEEQKKHDAALAALQVRFEEAEEKRRKADIERRSEDEVRRTKAMLDTHNAATLSSRRPGAPSSHTWSTQSVSRPRRTGTSANGGGTINTSQSSQRRGTGPPSALQLHGQQTPAPGRAGRELLLRSGSPSGGRGRGPGADSPTRPGTPSPRAASRRGAAQAPLPAPPPPVPRFAGLHNSFNVSSAGGRRASSVQAGRGGLFKSALSQADRTSPVKLEGVYGGREAKKRRVEDSADDYAGGGMDMADDAGGAQVGAADDIPTLADEREGDLTPKAPRLVPHPSTSSPVPNSDGVEPAGGPMDVEVDGDEEEVEGDVFGLEDREEDEFWKPEEKDLLFAVLFTHQLSPLTPPFTPALSQAQLTAPSPSTTPSSSLSAPKHSTLQALLAPLPVEGSANARDRVDHARASGRILGALGAAGVGGGELVSEVLKGLQAMAKIFERLDMLSLLTSTLLLLRSIILHLPRAGQVLLRLPSFTTLISSVKDRHFPSPRPKVKSRALATAAAAVTEAEGQEEEGAAKGRLEKGGVVRAMLGVWEAAVWQAQGQADADVLAKLAEMPKLISGLLDLHAQPPDIIAQTVRILKLMSFFDGLFHSLLGFPDAQARARDVTRIPLVDLLCRLLRDAPAQATPRETLRVTLDIIVIFRTLCYLHKEEAVLVLSQQRALTPTIVVCLERCASAIWGVDVGAGEMRRSIPQLVPLLHLLSLLTSHEDTALHPTLKLADRLRSAPKADFPAAFERFMVAFGRICYAEVPDLEEMAAWEDGEEEGEGREMWRVWEGELERAGDIARDIFDQVVEGPEGDLVYGVFVLELDEEDESSFASSATHAALALPVAGAGDDDEHAAPPPSSQPLGPLMPEDDGAPAPNVTSDTEDEEDDLPPLPALMPSSARLAHGASQRKSGRIKARAVARQEEVVKAPTVEVVELMDTSEEEEGD